MKYFLSVIILSVVMANTTHAGQWEYVGLQDQVIKTLAISPVNSSCLFGSGDSLYKTTDGGLTWISVSSFPASDIAFHPGKPDTVYYTFGEEMSDNELLPQVWTEHRGDNVPAIDKDNQRLFGYHLMCRLNKRTVSVFQAFDPFYHLLSPLCNPFNRF